MTETVVGQLAHSCMRQRRPPPTSCLTCGKGGRKTSSKRSFGCNMDSKYPNTQTVQIHHLLDQFQWILTPGIVYLYCISLGGRSGVHVPNPLLKKPLCTTLHYTTLHYTTLHYTKLHYTTLHYTTLPFLSICVY